MGLADRQLFSLDWQRWMLAGRAILIAVGKIPIAS